jgi:tRNA pseudouridine55 synthase
MTIHGIIPVRKAPGMTSHDVVARIRKLTGQRRVGHTGTLDPDVEGVLPVCLGQATRIVEYVQELPKQYLGTMVLGRSTDTEDASGEVLEDRPVDRIDPAIVNEVFQRFHGTITQVPPMFSAVRVKGKRLYELAREGKEVKRPSRQVTIYRLRATRIQPEGPYPEVDFDVTCSRGTYVRTLCVDIGKALGYPAHMARLIRVKSGPFVLEDAVTLEELAEVAADGRWDEVLHPIDAVLGHLPAVVVSGRAESGVLNGQPLECDLVDGCDWEGRLIRVYGDTHGFCGIYRLNDDGVALAEKVFRNG